MKKIFYSITATLGLVLALAFISFIPQQSQAQTSGGGGGGSSSGGGAISTNVRIVPFPCPDGFTPPSPWVCPNSTTGNVSGGGSGIKIALGTYLKFVSPSGVVFDEMNLIIRNKDGKIVSLDTFNFPKISLGNYTAEYNTGRSNLNGPITANIEVTSSEYKVTNISDARGALNITINISKDGKYVKFQNNFEGRTQTFIFDLVTELNNINIPPTLEDGIGPFLNSNPGKYLMNVYEKKENGELGNEGTFKIIVNEDRRGFTAITDNPEPQPCYRFDNDLGVVNSSPIVVSSGQDVVALQTFLIGNGYAIEGIRNITDKSIFGPKTKESVIKFQHDNGISKTGYVGQITRAKLNSFCNPIPNNNPIIHSVHPSSAPAGAVVTIKGRNLSFSSLSDTYVTFTGDNSTGGGLNPQHISTDGKNLTFIVPNFPAGAYNIVVNGVVIKSRDNSLPFKLVSNSIPFKIISSTNNSPITVISPNGGEKWEKGKTYDITWTTNPITGSNISYVQIGLVDKRVVGDNDAREKTIAYRIPNTGMYPYTVPYDFGSLSNGNVSGDNYLIIVYPWDTNQQGDTSNGTFSIVNPATTTPPPIVIPVVTLKVTPNIVAPGQSAILKWSTIDAISCTGSGFRTYDKTSGTQELLFTVQATPTFSITCTGPGGQSVTKSVTLNVNNPVVTPSITSLSGPSTLNVGQRGDWFVIATDPAGTTLYYNMNCGNSTGSGGINSVGCSYYTAGTYTITATVRNASGLTAIKTATVQVVPLVPPPSSTPTPVTEQSQTSTPVPAPTITITTNPTKVQVESPFTLTWTSTNANSCSFYSVSKGLSGKGGSIASSGSFSNLEIEGNARATITCTGSGGSKTEYKDIEPEEISAYNKNARINASIWDAISEYLKIHPY